MNLNRLDFEVLHLLARYPTPGGSEDGYLWTRGQHYFYKVWGGTRKRGKYYHYAPIIALALGRLSQAGLVEKIKHESTSFCRWFLTPEGEELVRGMVIDA